MSRAVRAAVVAVVVVLTGSACDYVGLAGPRTGLIGDSVSRGADAEIVAAVTATPARLVRWSANARTVRDQLGPLEVMQENPPPARLVVQLGANDAGQGHSSTRMRSDIRRFLSQALTRSRCVRWLNLPTSNIATPNARYAPGARMFNRVLAAETARARSAGHDAAVADFDGWAARHRSAMFGDGLHIAPSGRPAFARFIASAAETCRS